MKKCQWCEEDFDKVSEGWTFRRVDDDDLAYCRKCIVDHEFEDGKLSLTVDSFRKAGRPETIHIEFTISGNDGSEEERG